MNHKKPYQNHNTNQSCTHLQQQWQTNNAGKKFKTTDLDDRFHYKITSTCKNGETKPLHQINLLHLPMIHHLDKLNSTLLNLEQVGLEAFLKEQTDVLLRHSVNQ